MALLLGRQQEILEALKANKRGFRLAGKGADQEIILLKISSTGVIPAVIRTILDAFHIELG